LDRKKSNPVSTDWRVECKGAYERLAEEEKLNEMLIEILENHQIEWEWELSQMRRKRERNEF